jgi:hypothetical protein
MSQLVGLRYLLPVGSRGTVMGVLIESGQSCEKMGRQKCQSCRC